MRLRLEKSSWISIGHEARGRTRVMSGAHGSFPSTRYNAVSRKPLLNRVLGNAESGGAHESWYTAGGALFTASLTPT